MRARRAPRSPWYARQRRVGHERVAGAVPGRNLIDAQTKHRQNQNALAVAKTKWAGLGLSGPDLDALLRGATSSNSGSPVPGGSP